MYSIFLQQSQTSSSREPVQTSTMSLVTINTTERPTTILSTPRSTSKPGVNLTELITASNKTQPNVQALKELVEILEENVQEWSRGGDQEGKVWQLINILYTLSHSGRAAVPVCISIGISSITHYYHYVLKGLCHEMVY